MTFPELQSNRVARCAGRCIPEEDEGCAGGACGRPRIIGLLVLGDGEQDVLALRIAFRLRRRAEYGIEIAAATGQRE